MNIGKAAAASGVSAKMIRHYEEIGLIPSVARQASNYRDYAGHEIRQLRFIRRARLLGFSILRIRDLLRLWTDRDRASADVKSIALAHIVEIEDRIRLMQEMATTLRELAASCEGNDRPDCPILRGLEGSPAVA